MMRITYCCLTCHKTVRREMPSGKGGSPQGGVVKCPNGHGKMVRKDGRDAVAICGLTVYGRNKRDVSICQRAPGHQGECGRLRDATP